MTSIISGNNYYHLNTITQHDPSGRHNISTILLKPTKMDNAETFLKNLHECVIRDNSTINLPEGSTLSKVVDGVVLGYQSKLNKLGILQRIWQCFSTIITYPLRLLGINLTQAQRIQHYVKAIKAGAANQSILLSSDTAFDLKKQLIHALPINSPERTKILSYSTEQCLEKMTNNPANKFLVCKCYLKNGDIEKVRDLLLGLNEEDKSDIKGLFPEAIFICIEREISANDLIEKMFAVSKYGIFSKDLDKIVSRCSKVGKLDQLLASIDASSINKDNKNELYDALVRGCLKKIDVNELISRNGEPQKQTQSEKFVKMLHSFLDKISFQHALELAKLFIAIEDYPAAIKVVKLIYLNETCQALLVEISSLCTNKGQFELALKSLKVIAFMDTPSIVNAVVELVAANMEVDLDFAFKILKKFQYVSDSQLQKELSASAMLLFEHAMAINNFRMATEVLGFTYSDDEDLIVECLMRILTSFPNNFDAESIPIAKEIVDALFKCGIENNEYFIAIKALGTLLFKIEGQDLTELHQYSLERLLEIYSLVESDGELKKLVASYIANCKKLLDIQDA
jgi:hypothetical protein